MSITSESCAEKNNNSAVRRNEYHTERPRSRFHFMRLRYSVWCGDRPLSSTSAAALSREQMRCTTEFTTTTVQRRADRQRTAKQFHQRSSWARLSVVQEPYRLPLSAPWVVKICQFRPPNTAANVARTDNRHFSVWSCTLKSKGYSTRWTSE